MRCTWSCVSVLDRLVNHHHRRRRSHDLIGKLQAVDLAWWLASAVVVHCDASTPVAFTATSPEITRVHRNKTITDDACIAINRGRLTRGRVSLSKAKFSSLASRRFTYLSLVVKKSLLQGNRRFVAVACPSQAAAWWKAVIHYWSCIARKSGSCTDCRVSGHGLLYHSTYYIGVHGLANVSSVSLSVSILDLFATQEKQKKTSGRYLFYSYLQPFYGE